MRHLPVLPSDPANARDFELNAIDVETPCEVPWDTMQGDNRVRHCGHCRQNVYNIEALPRAEAIRLIGAREGRVCVRFHRRRDGTVVTADCWARLRAARRKGWLAFAAMLVIVGTAQLFAMLAGLAGLGRLGRQGEIAAPAITPSTAAPVIPPSATVRRSDVVMGKMVMPPEPLPPTAPVPHHHLMGKMRAR